MSDSTFARLSAAAGEMRELVAFQQRYRDLIKLLDDSIGSGGMATDLVSVTMTKEQAAMCVTALKSAIE